MRIRFARQGFWLIRAGSSVQYAWRWLLPFVITPILFAGLLALAMTRTSTFGMLLQRHAWRPILEFYCQNNRVVIENLCALKPVPSVSAIPTLSLTLDDNTLRAMQLAKHRGDSRLGHKPGSDTPYFNAYYTDETGQRQRAKIALRGANRWHHYPDKPSLRVKIKKADVARGARYVELSRPEDVLAFRHRLAGILAGKLGLVAPINEPVRLFLNNKYRGVYERSLRLGEPLALKNGRLPGTFFKGTIPLARPDLDLWASSQYWRKFGEAAEADVAVFDGFLATLRQAPSHATLRQLARFFDTQVYAKWSAVMAVTGSIHTDARHNQVLFLCPNQGKLEAVPWDANCHENVHRPYYPIDAVLHPIMDMINRDPRWVYRRNQLIGELVNGIASPEALHALLEHEVDRVQTALESDPNLANLELKGFLLPYSVLEIETQREEFKAWATDHARYLRAYLADARVWVAPAESRPGWSRIEVFGTAPVRTRVEAHEELVGDGARGRSLLLYPGLAENLSEAHFNPAMAHSVVRFSAPAPLVYFVKAPPSALRFTNAITGNPVLPQAAKPDFQGAVRSLHPWRFPAEPEGEIVLGPGTVVVERDLIVGPKQTLVIRPGTRLELRKGIGIYANGRTLARGTADAPIEIGPADPEPWAAVGVYGAASEGSRFEHLRVAGGSVGTHGTIRFKGMFNVYNCPNVELRHCRFDANRVGDDAVNLAESHIRVEHCQWNDAFRDGLDVDQCTGSIAHCRWRNCGNDALDLMNSRLRIDQCVFRDSGDKGISIGEATVALVTTCEVVRCRTGIEAKDDSHVIIRDSTFDGNGRGLHAYQKKWMYNRGGSVLLMGCRINNSDQADLSIQGRSRAELLRTPVVVAADERHRIVTVSGVNRTWQELIEELNH